MRRLRILTWPIHGSYFNTLATLNHDWYLPTKPGTPEGYGGRGRAPFPPTVQDVAAPAVRELDLDLLLLQSRRNLEQDTIELLTPAQRALPRIYLEHNTPLLHAVESRHPFQDPGGLLVHVTSYNRLMWDNGVTPTMTVEHSVAIDPAVRYRGTRAEGITVINSMPRRGRRVGLDLLLAARTHLPIALAGFENDGLDGLGDIPYPQLHDRMADYRFLFSPCRYTSLPLAVIEAMTIGMPIVALATTELPSVIENGVHGYVSNDLDELVVAMQRLLDDQEHARILGANARDLALRRFGLPQFAAAWNSAFSRAIDLSHRTTARSHS